MHSVIQFSYFKLIVQYTIYIFTYFIKNLPKVHKLLARYIVIYLLLVYKQLILLLYILFIYIKNL